MEKDDEVKGESNSYNFGARLYDSRIGNWFSVDPLFYKTPGWSPYNFVLNSPINLIDPTGLSAESPDNEYKSVWNKETKEYEKKEITNLGGDKFDVVHYEGGEKDGLTELSSNGETEYIRRGADVIKGYSHRNKDINWKNIFTEFKKGFGPKRSLMDEEHPMTNDMKMSYAAYLARSKFLENGGEKEYVPVNFGLLGILRSNFNMTEQMVGSSGISIYPLGNNVIFLITDTKSPKSLFYRLPGVKSRYNRDYNIQNKPMPYSVTKQSYIWIESLDELKQNHFIYETRYDTDW